MYSRTKGREYYQNTLTGDSQWHPPTVSVEGLESPGATVTTPSDHDPARRHNAGTEIQGPDGYQLTQRHEDGDDGNEKGKCAAVTSRTQHATDKVETGELMWQHRAMRAEALVVSLTVDLRTRDQAVEELEMELAHLQQSLQSSAAEQSALLIDAQQQARSTHQQEMIAHLDAYASRLKKSSQDYV